MNYLIINQNKLVEIFDDGEVDVIVLWEPFAFQALQLLGAKIKIHDNKSLSALSFNLISQTADNLLVEKASCVIQGLRTAIDYIAAHPKQSQKNTH